MIALGTAFLNKWKETQSAGWWLKIEHIVSEKMLDTDYVNLDDYPDLAMLPVLASLFHVTTDYLLGVEGEIKMGKLLTTKEVFQVSSRIEAENMVRDFQNGGQKGHRGQGSGIAAQNIARVAVIPGLSMKDFTCSLRFVRSCLESMGDAAKTELVF